MLRLLLFSLLLVKSASADLECSVLDEAFREATTENDTAACNCHDPGFYSNIQGLAVSCIRKALPSLYNALHAVDNETEVGELRIWQAQIHALQADFIGKFRPATLSIERSELAVIRDGFFKTIPNIQTLNLRANLLNIVYPAIGKLKKLVKLDLAGNKITTVPTGIWAPGCPLKELNLDGNSITDIEDGAFVNLRSLKKLNLASNHLTVITRHTFKGLDSLEYLNLQNNRLDSIDWSAFAHMRKLRTLDLGTNHVTNVDLRGLERLEKLFINNNSIHSIKNISLRDLPSLVLASLDRNSITEIGDGDLSGLAKSTNLESLTFEANHISQISSRAFMPIQHVSVLAIQNNNLTSLRSADGHPFLAHLRRLKTLLVSSNLIRAINENDIPKTVTTFAADNNMIEKIDVRAFDGIPMERLYLNNNKLTFLPKTTFDSISFDTLRAVDVSANNWQCVCGEEWLGSWLDKAGLKDVSNGLIGCLAAKCPAEEEEETRPAWVKIVAYVLAALSLLFLVIIVLLFYKEGTQKELMRPLRGRTNSDLHKLISDEPLLQSTLPSQGAQGDKKRVRFQDSS